jgi:hypothetical protein
MILATHGIVAGALGKFFPGNPLAAFLVGYASHLVLDAIPHWQYKIYSSTLNAEKKIHGKKDWDMVFGKDFIFDIARISVDFFAGLLIPFVFFNIAMDNSASYLSIIAGSFGGMLPDGLQFIYAKFKHEPMITIQKIHDFAESREHLVRTPKERFWGMTWQMGLCVASLLASHLISN